jgi:hypothetical protein
MRRYKQELAKLVIFAKQTNEDLTQFTVHQSPYELNYDELERLLAVRPDR